jgi:hypothetical protein
MAVILLNFLISVRVELLWLRAWGPKNLAMSLCPTTLYVEHKNSVHESISVAQQKTHVCMKLGLFPVSNFTDDL